MSKMWFLVIVLTGGGDVEQHVAIEMPNQMICEGLAQGYVHAAAYGGESLVVDEMRCEESDDG